MAVASLPSGANLLGMRSQRGRPLADVAGVLDLVDANFFTYNASAHQVWLKSRTVTPDAFADLWFFNHNASSLLRVVELDRALDSHQLRTRYRTPEQIVCRRGYQVSAGSAVENLVTHALTGVAKGELVRVEYYVRAAGTRARSH
jgi:hypothetical protein